MLRPNGRQPCIILLTGAVGAGKSTAASRALKLLAPVRYGGFTTHSVMEKGVLSVYICACDGSSPLDDAHRIGIRHGAGRFTAFPEVFETTGLTLLEQIPTNTELLLFDELGIMENGAPRFAKAVLAALSGPLPALCVIKPKPSPLLDAVRALPESVLIEVTPQNRNTLPARIAAYLRQSVCDKEQV